VKKSDVGSKQNNGFEEGHRIIRVKSKGKTHHRTDHKGPEGD